MARPGEFVTLTALSAADMNALPGGVLGYAQVTANQTGITANTDLTGLAVTVDVPAGRRIRITGHGQFTVNTTDRGGLVIAQEGTTQLGRVGFAYVPLANASFIWDGSVVVTPSSGSHTYKLTAQHVGGSGSTALDASATIPAYILVEDIGPA